VRKSAGVGNGLEGLAEVVRQRVGSGDGGGGRPGHFLFCFPTPRREQSARKALAAAGASRERQIATAALDPRTTCPACGPAWRPLHGGHLADTPRCGSSTWTACCPTPGASNASIARRIRTADDPPRSPQRLCQRPGWRILWRPTNADRNASRRTPDSAGQRRNIPARQQTRLSYSPHCPHEQEEEAQDGASSTTANHHDGEPPRRAAERRRAITRNRGRLTKQEWIERVDDDSAGIAS
jgi:hypothetical protein